ncbi:tetratricopeptide repeat protein [Streptomyces sp. NPDC052225]|uniref:tetratricopeptide repeat protein n=1 Tax=Streptomyces sp. NPDC052225 TaxID=3154949 RepID=UPI0034322F95
MAEAEPTMQELIRRRRRAGFIARRDELAAFRANFEVSPGDERHRFLFHVHGLAGVGKTSLLKEMADVAREFRAVTATVDEAVGSVPEVMAEVCAQFARSGHRLKELERRLAVHRERRHEAEAAVPAAAQDGPPTPSAASSAMVRAGLAGVGLIPGMGPFAGAADSAQLALGADRLRAALSARLSSQDDVQLVMSPEKVLTPILLRELNDVAAAVPWVVLFFDTYERTGPFLDAWLHDLMTTGRHGTLPANVVVVTAGQRPLDMARWGADAAVLETMPLDPFTEEEARGLLAAKGISDEQLVAKILNVTGCLPVLVSMLANGRPTSIEDIGEPSTAAVTLFLKWEREDRRDVALACALPRRLDADVFRAAVDGTDEEADALHEWLRGLAFVGDRAGRVQYHPVVRRQMLCLQRQRSPREWSQRHGRLAEAFEAWRTEAGAPLTAWERWRDQRWRELRVSETYHRLCADPKTALGPVLRLTVDVLDDGRSVDIRNWAQMLVEAGEDAAAEEAVGRWGHDLLAALDEGGVLAALDLLLDRAGFDGPTRGLVRGLRARELRVAGEYEKAVAEYGRAAELDPELQRAYYGRGYTRLIQARDREALADLDRALELDPDDVDSLIQRAEAVWFLGETAAALRGVEDALHREPSNSEALALQGVLLYELGRPEEALDALDRSAAGDGVLAKALKDRERVHRQLGKDSDGRPGPDEGIDLAPYTGWLARQRVRQLDDDGRYAEAVVECDRGLRLGGPDPVMYWHRGVAHRALDRADQALGDFARALAVDPDFWPARTDRARLLAGQGARDEALADLDDAMADRTAQVWYPATKGDLLYGARRFEEALAAYELALEIDDRQGSVHGMRGVCLRELGRDDEALAAAGRAVELEPSDAWALVQRAEILGHLGEHERAMADLDRAVDLAPADAWVRYERGEAHRLARRYEEALHDLDQALALDPDNGSAHGSRGAVLYRLDRDEEALAAFDRALELDPEYAWAWGCRAEVNCYLGRLEQAVSDVERAVRLAPPSSSWTLGRHARVMLAVGRLDRALDDLRRYEEAGGERDWARRTRAAVRLYRGEHETVLADPGAGPGAGDQTDFEMLRLWMVALRRAGRMPEAAAVCERLCELDADEGAFEQAMTTTCLRGAVAARPLWQAVLRKGDGTGEPEGCAVAAAGLAEWSLLDAHLTAALAGPANWDGLEEFAHYLRLLATCQGVDAARLAPRIARVERARDEIGERFAV